MQERRHHRIPDVVVLAVDVEASGRAEGGVRGRGAGIAQRAGGADQGHDGQGAEAQFQGQRHVEGGDDGNGGEG